MAFGDEATSVMRLAINGTASAARATARVKSGSG